MRVLLCPLGFPGYAFPAIGVARVLAARGPVVSFATAAWLAPLLHAQGLPYIADPERGATFDTSAWHGPAEVALQVRHLAHAVARFAPDVLVTSALGLGALLAGERAGLPVAVIGLLAPLPPADATRRSELQAALDACRARVGLPPVGIERMRGDLYLPRGVPELVDAPNPIGACSWEPATPKVVTEWVAAARGEGRRIVYVHEARGFGAPGFWSSLRDALPGDVRIAASTSRMDGGPRSAPPGALVGPVVPHGAVMEHAAAVVCSGTTAVVVAALAHGVPLVVVPAGGEQPDVAAIVARAGAGVSLPAVEVTPVRLGDAFARALASDPAPRAGLRRAFARFEGAEVAASRIELLSSRAP